MNHEKTVVFTSSDVRAPYHKLFYICHSVLKRYLLYLNDRPSVGINALMIDSPALGTRLSNPRAAGAKSRHVDRRRRDRLGPRRDQQRAQPTAGPGRPGARQRAGAQPQPAAGPSPLRAWPRAGGRQRSGARAGPGRGRVDSRSNRLGIKKTRPSTRNSRSSIALWAELGALRPRMRTLALLHIHYRLVLKYLQMAG